MTKEEVNIDFIRTKLMIKKGIERDNYAKVFPNTNENLKRILENFDIEGKKVLTTLASGDQALNFLNRKAASVETFDINKLTIYYYYIRIWSIIYFDSYYPIESLSDLLDKVKPKNESEKDAYIYWTKYLDEFGNRIKFFHNGYNSQAPQVAKIKDLSYLQERLKREKIIFYNFNISDEIKLNKKYDIIYTSNVQRWIPRYNGTIDMYRDNLDLLLEDDGYIICSNVTIKSSYTDEDVRCMCKKFDFHSMEEAKDIGFQKVPGYYYTKKRK